MILIKPSFEIITNYNSIGVYHLIELAGRTAYKSESKMTVGSAEKFIRAVIARKHDSVLEHMNITIKFVVDRGVTHELVRHRIASYTQESTRWCNYKGGVTFIIPPWVKIVPGQYDLLPEYITDPTSIQWFLAMYAAEVYYKTLINGEWSPQQARSVLPNSLKTEIVVTCNIREWRHILKLRTAKDAHPQMQEIMISLLEEFKKSLPIFFEDINV